MLGMRFSRTRFREEGEKPFWISYSDLMTALMVLFLVVMSVSILTITQELLEKQERLIAQQQELERTNSEMARQRNELEQKNAELERQQIELALAKKLMDALKATRDERQRAINQVMDRLEISAAGEAFKGRVSIARDRMTVDFGEAARFKRGDYRFSRDGAAVLRAFIPAILDAVDSVEGKNWFRRVVVEGFTDTDGSYLFNLDLSLKRAQTVVCALMDTPIGETALTMEQQRRVRELFLVGGFSFNSARASKEESRRVELRLDFQSVEDHMTVGDHLSTGVPPLDPLQIETGKCQMR